MEKLLFNTLFNFCLNIRSLLRIQVVSEWLSIVKKLRMILFIFVIFCLTSCGFKPRGSMPLAPSLYHLYLETPDPYGQLTRNLRQFLKMSGVSLTESPEQATAILTILSENTNDHLLGINGTQQTRQYNLTLTVTFQLSNPNNRILVTPQTVTESRTLTITNDQILASNNEAMSLYSQMRQVIVYDIMSRLSSEDITTQLTTEPEEPIKIQEKTLKKQFPQQEPIGK
jgi:LPS-assembly lipoprotein